MNQNLINPERTIVPLEDKWVGTCGLNFCHNILKFLLKIEKLISFIGI